MPAVSKRLWAVLYGIPRLSAISCIVNPFTVITSLSEKIYKKLSKISIISIQMFSGFAENLKFLSKKSIFSIDKNIEKFYIYGIS